MSAIRTGQSYWSSYFARKQALRKARELNAALIDKLPANPWSGKTEQTAKLLDQAWKEVSPMAVKPKSGKKGGAKVSKPKPPPKPKTAPSYGAKV